MNVPNSDFGATQKGMTVLRRGAVVALASVLVLASSTIAQASDTDDQAEEVAATVEAVSPDLSGSAALVEPRTSAAAPLELGDATLPLTADGIVSIETTSGVSIVASLPEALQGAAAQTAGGASVVYTTGGELDLTVQATGAATRFTTVMNSADAPSEHAYTFANATPTLQDDGSVVLTVDLGDGVAYDAAVIDRAWAFDGDGEPVETAYRVVGNTVIQEVETTSQTTYPVVADPTVDGDCGIITCTVRFNRANTKKIANGTNLEALAGAVLAVVLPPAAPAIAIIVAYLAVFNGYAADYYSNGNCFALKTDRTFQARWAEQTKKGTYNCS